MVFSFLTDYSAVLSCYISLKSIKNLDKIYLLVEGSSRNLDPIDVDGHFTESYLRGETQCPIFLFVVSQKILFHH